MVSEPTLLGLKSMVSANKMRRLKYSCEEVYERMDNGLCIFCDELDTPGHHDMKHKGIQIFIVDDDLASDDIEEFHQTQETVTEPIVEIGKNLDSFIEPLVHESVSQVLDSVPDVFMVCKVDSHVKEVEESPQQSTNSDDENVAYQVFAQMPLRVISKEKQRKSLKAWKFKFKASFKRSKLMDNMLSVVEETVLLDKDHKETIWDCVKKEFKEAVAGYGKRRVDRFKLVDENELTSEVLDQIVTFMYHQTLNSDSTQKHVHVKETQAPHKSSGNNLHHISHQQLDKRCLRIDGKKLKSKCLKSWRFKFKISSMKARPKVSQDDGFMESFNNLVCSSWIDEQFERRWSKMIGRFEHNENNSIDSLVSDFKTWVPHFGYEFRLAGTDHVLGLVWSSFESDMTRLWRGPEVVLWFNSEKMDLDWFFQRDLHKLCLDIRRMIILLCLSADYRKLKVWVDTNYCEIRPDKTQVKLQEMSCFLSEKSLVEFVGYKAHGRELIVMVVKQLTLAATKFHLKHKWRSRLLQSFSELKQRIIVSLWKPLGYLRKAHGSKYERLVCALERKKLRTIEDDIDHLKKLLATMEGLAQKISCGLIYGDVNFHLKHKWRSRLLQTLSRLEFCVDDVILFTSSVKLLFPKNHKLLHYEAEFCAQYNDLKQLRTESQSSPGLDYFAYLIFLWNQALNCGCEAGHISSGFFFVGDVHEFFACSKLQNGDERYGKRLLDVKEISMLDNDNKVDFTIKANWFYNKPMIREVFHLQRPPELIYLQGNPNFITKVLVQWKEHPPDQFSQAFMCKYSCFHP